MTGKIETRRLASGPGWHVVDLACHSGPDDVPFEEAHDTVAIAAVLSGTFVYRTTEGRSLLTPGSILLGNRGRCFECRHEHGVGDRCLSFHFTADGWEDIAGAAPGEHGGRFQIPSLPPTASLLPIMARIGAARDLDGPALEELALELAGGALRLAGGGARSPGVHREADERRVSEAIRRIELSAYELEEDRLSLPALAREARMSRYHFLRVFRRLVGLTPYQYVLHLRMQRAAAALLTAEAPMTTVALDAGFNDLSTFIRRFRRVMGASPGEYRRRMRDGATRTDQEPSPSG